MDILRLALAQINTTVGDFQGNSEKIITCLKKARHGNAHIVLFPELTLCGYPPEVDVKDDIYNAAAILHDGKLAGIYHKRMLPNYGVFDEDRYFRRGTTETLYDLDGIVFGVSICEDMWYPAGPPERQATAGAKLLLNMSSSPYHVGKIQSRERMMSARASDNVAVIAYCNQVGGQDELVFDGSSVVIDERGKTLARAKSYEEDFLLVDVNLPGVMRQRLRDPRRRKGSFNYVIPAKSIEKISLTSVLPISPSPISTPTLVPFRSTLEETYTALVTGTRDYIRKNGFQKVVIGLSGGIDSTLVACVAVDALGGDNVTGVSMPSRYSSDHSKSDAEQLAENLGIRYETVPIETIFQGYLDTLAPQFKGTQFNVAEENLQSRARGNILMALSNKFGWLVLATGNKSEMSVGYATLYGDMAGGFAVIKDVPKTLVYQLCEYRNTVNPVIPQNVIDKPPSAELRHDQKDTDSLPPYDILDAILKAYVEDDYDYEEIVSLGYDVNTVQRVIRMVDTNEYKRRQAPPGVKITSRAFGKDRRLPLTNHYKVWE
ncbi:MAG: NAD+ synthase [Anaerolineaceae bacterium 4572_78]|nr:MAG: NAD+ synthase [Anaerolineaceae bacterium 4572_78]